MGMQMVLSLSQQQRVTIAPQIRQSIEILQMSSLELAEFLSQKFMENPFIELKTHDRFRSAIKSTGSRTEQDWWHNLPDPGIGASLENVLLEQLNFLSLDKRLHAICRFVIGCLDANGYLSVSVPLIAEQNKVTTDEVKEALRVIQDMEPYGVAASCLSECLLIQLYHTEDADDLMRALVEHDLTSIAQGKINPLAHKYKKKPCDIQQALDRIGRLNPKPGAAFTSEPSTFIVPDLFLRQQDDEVRLLLNDSVAPQIRINHQYEEMLTLMESQEVQQYLRNQLKEVKWIAQSLETRKATLLKVANVIFELQAGFCKRGPAFIRPITLQQVADVLQIHESTVSRTVNGKYAETPWGIFELKSFFSSSIRQHDGDKVSAILVKRQIHSLIRKENKSAPLSDQKITDLLKADGMIISRRTVTKYREQIHFPSTHLRIRYDVKPHE